MRKVYSASGYGAIKIFVRPGVDEPDDDRWHDTVTDEHGQHRLARQYMVAFSEGVAQVEDELARYLIEQKIASGQRLEIVRWPLVPTPKPTLCERLRAAVVGIFK